MGVSRSREVRAGSGSLDAWLAGAVVAAVVGLFACDTAGPVRDVTTKTSSALTAPDYGQTITVDFKTDAAGAPLPRATVLAEQYAGAGIHFQGGFVLGDRDFDFSDFHTATPDNLICAGPRADGRCAGAATISDTNHLVVTFDFPVCAVAIAGLGIPNSIQDGVVGVAGYDVMGNNRDQWSSRLIVNTAVEGRKYGWIPGGGFDYQGPFPSPSLDVRRVEISGRGLGALDDLVVTRCREIVPRCKPALVCVPESAACVSSMPVSVDDGSYSSTAGAVTLTQSPAAPYSDGPIPVTLTVTDGVHSESCSATVRVGHCDVAQIDCPASEIVECAALNSGPGYVTCTPYYRSANVSDGCREASLGSISAPFSCVEPGAPTPVELVANDLRGVAHKCTTVVTVVDRTPPSASTFYFQELTPVDGLMHTFTLADVGLDKVHDACDLDLSGPDHVAMTCITADEPSASGSPDIEIVDATTFKVRASSDRKGDGRIYTVSVIGRDRAGNVSGPLSNTIGVPRPNLEQYGDSGVRQKVCRPVDWPMGGAGGGAGGAGGTGGATGMGGAPGAAGQGGAASTGGAVGTGGAPGKGGRSGQGGKGGRGGRGDHGGAGGLDWEGCAVAEISSPSSTSLFVVLGVWALGARRRKRRLPAGSGRRPPHEV